MYICVYKYMGVYTHALCIRFICVCMYVLMYELMYDYIYVLFVCRG